MGGRSLMDKFGLYGSPLQHCTGFSTVDFLLLNRVQKCRLHSILKCAEFTFVQYTVVNSKLCVQTSIVVLTVQDTFTAITVTTVH